jgi:hypothetical protein
MFAAPTAMRAIKRDDPEGNLIAKYGNKRGIFLNVLLIFIRQICPP